MTWPDTPTEPGGPPGRRLPTPDRGISIRIDSLAPAGVPPRSAPALRPPGGLRPDRRLGSRELFPGGVALRRHADLVRIEDRREAQEADPEHHGQPDAEDDQEDDELEVEHRRGHHEAEQGQTGPEQPLP